MPQLQYEVQGDEQAVGSQVSERPAKVIRGGERVVAVEVECPVCSRNFFDYARGAYAFLSASEYASPPL